MAKARTHLYWKRWVWRLKGDNPSLSAVEIEERLQALVKEAPKNSGSPPAARTIRDIVKEPRPAGIREEEFLSFRWPQSMERGDLPWEASERCLELLRHLQGERPSVRLAKWFWRVSLAIPNEPIGRRHALAQWLDTIEFFGVGFFDGGPPELAGLTEIDWFLAFRPWVGLENSEAYAAAIGRQKE